MGIEVDAKNRPAAPTRAARQLLGAGLLLGGLADLLLYGEVPGLSVPLLTLAALALLFGLARVQEVRPARANGWLLVPLLLLAAGAFLRAAPFLLFLNIGFGLLLLGLLARFFAAGRAVRLQLRTFFILPLLVAGHALARPLRLAADALGRPTAATRTRWNPWPVLRGLLLALPVLVLFGFLLASADLVFAQLVRDLLHFRVPVVLQELLWQLLLVLVTAWMTAGALAYALDARTGEEEPLRTGRLPLHLGFGETATLLAAVNVLFFVFVWIQFTYLFGGEEQIAALGYTYSEYARRGFLDLLAVSVLTLGLLLALQRVARLETAARRRRFGLLGSLLIAFVLVILASAFLRLHLYEEAYGFTRLRLYSHLFILWLGAAMLWLGMTHWRRGTSFGIGAFGAVLGFVLTLNLLNPDAFIARRNLQRYAATGRLDVHYLTRLSSDAVPVLAAALDDLDGPERTLLRQHLQRHRAALEALRARTGWPSFHYARHRALRILQQLETAEAPP